MTKGAFTVTLSQFQAFIKDKKVALLGAGVSNLPLISWLKGFGASVTVRDKNEKLVLPSGVTADKLVLGENYLENITEDILFRSPGMRFDEKGIADAVARGAFLTSEIEMLFELCPCRIIAVTGSDGKTTTTTLISEMLKRAGKRVWLGGNIGTPLCHKAFEMEKDDTVVLELSSFQLHTMRKSPDIAVVTNIAPNHLDKHKDYNEYIEAKKNVFLYQNAGGKLIANADNSVTAPFSSEAKGSFIPFCYSGSCRDGVWLDENGVIFFKDEPVLNRADIILPGDHNVENYMAAIAAVYGEVGKEVICGTASSFGGVRHRIEFVKEVEGVRYYNDSIGTSPSRSTAGLKSFDQKIILIAGGYDKHLDYTDLGKIIANKVKLLIVTGDTAKKIEDAARAALPSLPVIYCKDFDSTVSVAHQNAVSGDVVMLSPASASFDRFKNFEERGDHFVSLVKAL
ncbi:MAG: UDP-N-acetylmuramoyl-L-alanine--D-glutamate ligase [Clostridia bacterium]|nr:UDP-N-acetylmuramoyl-L-alanine--D-glutamate ligase [Clostridia bacterium]